jgi:hypothetical protein
MKEFDMFKKVPFSLIHSSRIWMILLISGIALLATACGSPAATQSTDMPTVATAKPESSSTSSIPLKADACTLLTKDDVSKVLGQAVEEATGKGLGGVCSFTTKDLSFDLTVVHSGGAKYMQDTRAKLGDLALDVAGLGDGAFYNTNSFINTLFVGKGDAVYLIDVMNGPSSQTLSPEDVQAKEKALAEVLLSHLP